MVFVQKERCQSVGLRTEVAPSSSRPRSTQIQGEYFERGKGLMKGTMTWSLVDASIVCEEVKKEDVEYEGGARLRRLLVGQGVRGGW